MPATLREWIVNAGVLALLVRANRPYTYILSLSLSFPLFHSVFLFRGSLPLDIHRPWHRTTPQ